MLRSECARTSGCNPETIRYYESIGLLDPPRRSAAGYRHYDDHHLQQLALIRTARELGLATPAIHRLLDLARDPDAPCQEADDVIRHQIALIDARIRRFQQLRDALAGLLAACPGDVVADCRILQSLAYGRLPAPAKPKVRHPNNPTQPSAATGP